MDSLRQSTGKLSGLLRGHAIWLGPTLLVATILAVLVGIGTILYVQQPGAARISLLGDRSVSEAQMATMVTAFVGADLADFEVREGRVMVPAHGTSRYLAALGDAKALPPEFHAYTGDAVGQNRFFESERDRQRRIGHAEEKDLATAINRMPGIEEAMVKCDESESQGFQKQRIVTASVNIVTAPNYVLGRQRVDAIRNLVANARAGLNPVDVCVTDLRSGCSYAGNSDQFQALPLAQDYLTIKHMIEHEWHEKVTSLLSRFVPNANVVVSVDLPEGWQPSSQQTPERRAPQPERIAISIQVPSSSYRRVKTVANVGTLESVARADGHDELDQRIRSAVTSLLAQDSRTQVSVHIDQYNDEAKVTQVADNGWLAIWQRHRTAWLVVLAIGATVAILPLARQVWLRPASIEVAAESTAGSHEHASTMPFEMVDDPIDEHQLRGTLAELVRDDPDSAAEILHQWLDRAG